MKKLVLDIDRLDVQSFATTPALKELRCTVRGHMAEPTYGEQACTAACSPDLACAACETGGDACAPAGTDAGRRIIVYS